MLRDITIARPDSYLPQEQFNPDTALATIIQHSPNLHTFEMASPSYGIKTSPGLMKFVRSLAKLPALRKLTLYLTAYELTIHPSVLHHVSWLLAELWVEWDYEAFALGGDTDDDADEEEEENNGDKCDRKSKDNENDNADEIVAVGNQDDCVSDILVSLPRFSPTLEKLRISRLPISRFLDCVPQTLVFPRLKELYVMINLTFHHYIPTSTIIRLFPQLQCLTIVMSSISDAEGYTDFWLCAEDWRHRNLMDVDSSSGSHWLYLDYIMSSYYALYLLGLKSSVGILVINDRDIGITESMDAGIQQLLHYCRPQALLKLSAPFTTKFCEQLRAALLDSPQLVRLDYDRLDMWRLDHTDPEKFISMHRGTSLEVIYVRLFGRNFDIPYQSMKLALHQQEFAQRLADSCTSLQYYSVKSGREESCFEIVSTPDGRRACLDVEDSDEDETV
ncbi:hypothetical protein K474DRAFT_1769028 [Panus rudis PR-1116 ss-1]|nr:hypothetical protein K474DRAFT_1769028 [Panus rudis PR-1116 ss-1]